MINFLDTCYLLNNLDNLEGSFMISSITLGELESIKTSKNKDFSIKEKANKATKFIKDNYDRIKIMNFKQDYLNLFPGWEINNDLKIVATAIAVSSTTEVVFYTDDISCLNIARHCNLTVGVSEPKEDYRGYKEIKMSDNDMSEFYSDLNSNIFGLFINEYLIIKNEYDDVVDIRVWTGSEHRELKTRSFFSEYFGEVKAMKNDIYQKIAIDSLINNQLTVLRGPAGTGKTYLGLGYLLSQLEDGKIDKIVIMANPVCVRNAARLGFLPGDRNRKVLDSQVGNVLESKLGSLIEVERLIQEDKLMLLPVGDCRGWDSTGMKCGIIIDEAQNTTKDLMKLILQRIGEDSKVIILGDDKAQVDESDYEGDNNGLRRTCEVFKGEPYFGTSYLKNCHRSRIANKAEEM